MRFEQRFLVVSCFVLLLVLSCGDDKSTTPPIQPPLLNYPSESEQLALYTSGTLRSGDALTCQIDHELVLIRQTWGDSIPDVNMPFQIPWGTMGIGVRADSQLYLQIKAGTSADWNRLISDLDLKTHDYEFSFYPRYFAVMPRKNMHPLRLGEYFVGFPGVEYVHAGGNLQTWDDYFTRIATSNGAKYYFKRNTCPDLWDAYSYFEVDGDSAKFIGIHYECWDSLVNSPTWVPIERFEEIIDSLEAVRSPWVDSVRLELSVFGQGSGFNWSPE